MTNILFATRPIVPPWDEGSKNFSWELAQRLPQWPITVMTTKRNGVVWTTTAPFYTSPRLDYRQRARYLWYLLLRARSYSLINFFFTPRMLTSHWMRLVSLGSSTRLIQTIPCLPAGAGDAGLRNVLFADRVVTISSTTQKRLEARGITNVRTIPVGVNLKRFEYSRESRERWRAKLGLDNRFTVIYPGEFSRLGSLRLLQDIIHSTASNQSLVFIVACRIKSERDRDQRRAFVNWLAVQDLSAKVIVIDAAVDLAELYNACDACMFPVTAMDGKFDTPLAVIEAMAAGLPLLLSPVGALPEVAKQIGGIQIGENSAHEFAKAMFRLQNPDIKRRLGSQSRVAAERYYNIEIVAKQYSALYNQLINTKHVTTR